MKSRAQELVDKSVAAMVSAIEIYNKPDFKYREETFSILAINAWELLLKAKWLKEHDNKLRSLYVMERRIRPNGEYYKHLKVKLTACGNPFTHGLDYLAKKLVESGAISRNCHKNLDALCEIRDSAVHFYNRHALFSLQLQEVGSAALKNYVTATSRWFGVDLAQFNFYLMPLAFLKPEEKSTLVALNKEEKKLASFITNLEAANDAASSDAITISVDLHFTKAKSAEAIAVQLSKDPSAPKVQLTEQQIKDRYPMVYAKLSEACRKRYSDFKQNQKYHDLRTPLKDDRKYCWIRRLDPDNPSSLKQERYSEAVFTVLDKHYTKR